MMDDTVYRLTLSQRMLVLAVVVLGTTIYSATILITSALLPQLQGALSATQDEISWVMTFNIVATAVATPMTGWIAGRFGRRATMFWCSLGFTLATFMCGAATSLEELILWRIMQGPSERRWCRSARHFCSTAFHAISTARSYPFTAWRT